jgi:hypothetical protein
MAAAVKMYTNEHLAVRALALSHQNPSDAKSTVCTTLSRFTEGWSFSGHACHARVGTFICPRVHTTSIGGVKKVRVPAQERDTGSLHPVRTWRTLACVCTRCAARSGGYMMMKAKAGGVLAWRFCTVHIHDGRHSMLGEPSVRTRTRTCRRGYLCMARYPLEDLALAAILVQAAAAASTRIESHVVGVLLVAVPSRRAFLLFGLQLSLRLGSSSRVLSRSLPRVARDDRERTPHGAGARCAGMLALGHSQTRLYHRVQTHLLSIFADVALYLLKREEEK